MIDRLMKHLHMLVKMDNGKLAMATKLFLFIARKVLIIFKTENKFMISYVHLWKLNNSIRFFKIICVKRKFIKRVPITTKFRSVMELKIEDHIMVPRIWQMLFFLLLTSTLSGLNIFYAWILISKIGVNMNLRMRTVQRPCRQLGSLIIYQRYGIFKWKRNFSFLLQEKSLFLKLNINSCP